MGWSQRNSPTTEGTAVRKGCSLPVSAGTSGKRKVLEAAAEKSGKQIPVSCVQGPSKNEGCLEVVVGAGQGEGSSPAGSAAGSGTCLEVPAGERVELGLPHPPPQALLGPWWQWRERGWGKGKEKPAKAEVSRKAAGRTGRAWPSQSLCRELGIKPHYVF